MKYAEWCRCCGYRKDEHPIIIGYSQVCAIFMAYDLDEHERRYGKRL